MKVEIVTWKSSSVMIASYGLHPFSKWAISEEGTEGRSGEVLAQSPNKDHREPNREFSHSRLCCYCSNVTAKNSAPSTSTSMLHLDIMSKKHLGSVSRVHLVKAVA